VAVKLLLPEYSNSENVLARFFTEAKATSAIEHPGIVQIFDYNVHHNRPRLHRDGVPARREPAGGAGPVGPLTQDLPTAADILAQAAEAVGAAHDKAIVHRDLKPDNIFLLASMDRGRVPVKILDFGIAKLLASDPDAMSRTRTGNLLGTPSVHVARAVPQRRRGRPPHRHLLAGLHRLRDPVRAPALPGAGRDRPAHRPRQPAARPRRAPWASICRASSRIC
jgi:hypothetical protein